MIRALAPLIALSILVSAPASIAQDTPPPVANNNAALTYWQIWDTLDANLVEVATLVEPDETYEPGRPVTDALLQLQPDIRALMAAANNPHCDWQIDYDAGFDAVLPHLSKMRTTARLFREDARRLSAAGDTDEAVQRVVAAFNLAEQTAGDRVIISPLVGMAIAALATTETDALIAAGDLTADQRDQILATMAVIDQHDPFALADAIAHERDMMTTWVKREFTGDGAHEGSLALAVVPEHGDVRAVVHIHADAFGHDVVGIADLQVLAAEGAALAARVLRDLELHGALRLVDVEGLDPLDLLHFRAGLLGFAGLGVKAVDERLQLLALALDRLVVLDGLVLLLALEGEVLLDRAGIEGEPAQLGLEGVVAGFLQEFAVVRDDHEAAVEVLQELLKEDEGFEVEVVGRFIQNEEVGVIEQHGGEFHPGLVAAGEGHDGGLHLLALELEPRGHLAAAPRLLVGVAHEELQHGLGGGEDRMLLEIAQPQVGAFDDLALVGWLLAEDDLAQGGLAGTIASDEAGFLRTTERHVGAVEDDLRPEAFLDVFEL